MKKLFETVKNSWFGFVVCGMALMMLGSGIFEIIGEELKNGEIGKNVYRPQARGGPVSGC